ncbi:MAG: Fic family protein [archaeon]|nr:Fic family protein [archaeon]
MRLFDYSFIGNFSLSIRQSKILNNIHLTEERISVWTQHYPEAMRLFYEHRMIDDICGTHEIEHIPVCRADVPLLLSGELEPRNVDEQKVLGQRDAIQFWESLVEKKCLESDDFLKLHRLLMIRHDLNGGKFRTVNDPHIGYGTATAVEKPATMTEIRYVLSSFCRSYNQSFSDPDIDSLLLALCCALDYFSIAPFNNGNGRMYRLVLNLLLARAGVTVQMYSSLEKQILDHLDNHMVALSMSTNGWGGDFNGYNFFIDDILHNLNHCVDFLNEALPPRACGRRSKSERIEHIVSSARGEFNIGYVSEHAPDVSEVLIRNQLQSLSKSGVLEKAGNTRGTTYRTKGGDGE